MLQHTVHVQTGSEYLIIIPEEQQLSRVLIARLGMACQKTDVGILLLINDHGEDAETRTGAEMLPQVDSVCF